MAKNREQYITTTQRAAKPYRVRLKAWKIERYFPELIAAKRFRNLVVADLDFIQSLIDEGFFGQQFQKATDMIGNINDADYKALMNQLPNLHSDIRKALGASHVQLIEGVDLQGKLDITVAEMFSRYVEDWEAERRKKIYNRERFNWWAKYSPIRDKLCDTVSNRDLIDARNALMDEFDLSPKTANDYLKLFGTVWNHKLRSLHIGRHGAPQIKNLPHEPVRTVPYTREQVQQMIDFWYEKDEVNRNRNDPVCVFTNFGPLTELFSLTGIRKSFLESLEWKHIRWDEPTPCIRRPMKGDDGVKERAIPLSARAQEVLRELEANKASDRWVFPTPRSHDRHVAPGWYHYWKRVMIEAGFELSVKPIHGFRAFVATEMYRAGQPKSVIKTVLGCTEENLRHYITPDEADELRTAQAALNAL